MTTQPIIDWAALWRQLVGTKDEAWSERDGRGARKSDHWRHRAAQFDELSKGQAERASPIRECLAARISADSTVLDIGAGTGQWTAFLAPRVRHVTALDPSPAMLEILRQKVKDQRLQNVTVLEGSWPDAAVDCHDITLCAHAAYGSSDLPAFVRRMIEVTRRTCFVLLRLPAAEGIVAQAATEVWGHPHDSPNFVIGYNVLLQMGLRPNVVFDLFPWQPWVDTTLEDALGRLKRRLALGSQPSEHDAYLTGLLRARLSVRDGQYVWPDSVHTALAYWDVECKTS